MYDFKLWDIIDDGLDGIGLRRKSSAAGFGSFLFGLGCGLVAGGACALLLAPYSGSETREKLVRAGEDFGKTISGKVDELSKQLKGGLGNEQISSGAVYSSSGNSRLGM
jgi:gas vesicle protein